MPRDTGLRQKGMGRKPGQKDKFLKKYRAAYRRHTLVNPIIIFVKDFEKCLRFYRKVFGLHLLHRVGQWAELDAGGFVLSIHGGYQGERFRHQQPLGLHFSCRDVEKTGRRIVKYGGRCGKPRTLDFRPDELVTAVEARFQDSDGNEFELRQIVSID